LVLHISGESEDLQTEQADKDKITIKPKSVFIVAPASGTAPAHDRGGLVKMPASAVGSPFEKKA
jgi:hypothetical protein